MVTTLTIGRAIASGLQLHKNKCSCAVIISRCGTVSLS